MTELAVHDSRGELAPAQDMQQPPSSLLLWAAEARQAAQIAQSLAQTSFVPASLRGKPADITAAILAGRELGLQPMATLRSMDVIQGTPALRAHAMRGLVQARGHTVQLVEASPVRCVMRGKRAGDEAWQSVEWTIERAQMLGLTSKQQWKAQPQTMLIARATGELCRLIAADVLYAMPYASEELDAVTAVHAGSAHRPVTVEEITGVPTAPVPVASPAREEAWAPPTPEGHEGTHDAWGFSPSCETCKAEQAEADQQFADGA